MAVCDGTVKPLPVDRKRNDILLYSNWASHPHSSPNFPSSGDRTFKNNLFDTESPTRYLNPARVQSIPSRARPCSLGQRRAVTSRYAPLNACRDCSGRGCGGIFSGRFGLGLAEILNAQLVGNRLPRLERVPRATVVAHEHGGVTRINVGTAIRRGAGRSQERDLGAEVHVLTLMRLNGIESQCQFVMDACHTSVDACMPHITTFYARICTKRMRRCEDVCMFASPWKAS